MRSRHGLGAIALTPSQTSRRRILSLVRADRRYPEAVRTPICSSELPLPSLPKLAIQPVSMFSADWSNRPAGHMVLRGVVRRNVGNREQRYGRRAMEKKLKVTAAVSVAAA